MEHVRAEAAVVERFGRDAVPLSIVERVGEFHDARLRIVDTNAQERVVEHLPDLVADRVVHALQAKLARERLLHAVDDRELRGPLLALLEEALRLVEQPRVLEGHAHARGDCAE